MLLCTVRKIKKSGYQSRFIAAHCYREGLEDQIKADLLCKKKENNSTKAQCFGCSQINQFFGGIYQIHTSSIPKKELKPYINLFSQNISAISYMAEINQGISITWRI